ncbi:hypothetical protein B0919_18495 [Hymenobacter sp. CRA2]|nr:hypothetical protein B0919_18495 [Hymenobacter sp. CRA2]
MAAAAQAQIPSPWHKAAHSLARLPELAARRTQATVLRPAALTRYRWDELLNTWSTDVRSRAFTYDAQARLTSETVTDSATTTPYSRILHTFTAQGQPLEDIDQDWNGTAWANSARVLALYDARGRYAGEELQEWNNNAWTPVAGTRETHTYNAAGQLTETVYEDFDANQNSYRRAGRETYTVGPNGEWTDALGEDWTNGAYVKSYRTRNITWYSFAELKPSFYDYQDWNDASGSWINDSRTTTVYQSNGSFISTRQVLTGPNVYANVQRKTETYDNFGTPLLSQDERWQGGQWVVEDASRHLLSYNADNTLRRDVQQNYDNGTYTNTVRDVYGSYQSIVLATRTVAATVPAQLYPNPTTATAWLELGSARTQGPLSGQLLNALGQTVRPLRLTPAASTQRYALDLTGLAPGAYTVRLHADTGSVVQRIVKE